MKKTFIIFVTILFCLMSNIAMAQNNFRVEKNGVVLSREENSMVFFLENTTTDTVQIFVVNHEEKTQKLPGGVLIVNKGNHQDVNFTLFPSEIKNLTYIVCVHSTGLMIGGVADSNLITCNFGSMNTN